jgi:hypothetical protein
MPGKIFLISTFFVVGFCACRKPYIPPAISAPQNYLVVEGVIDPGSDSTIIKLSKTVSLSASTTTNAVLNATVTIQSSQGQSSWQLQGDGQGNYTSPGLNLPQGAQYRLSVSVNNENYASDYVPVNLSPPIDSVGYYVTSGGAQIYVNTHDPTGKTTFYMWNYQETWMFSSEYPANIKADTTTGTLVLIDPSQQIHHCFGNDASTNILLASTQALNKDEVYQSPLTIIPLNSEKVEEKYSILVKQYALTGDAYNFYTNLKKNSEQLGSIFDAMPSEIPGNIHDITRPGIPVIGYISISSVQSKRIFISKNALPNVTTIYPYACTLDTLSPSYAHDVFLIPPAQYDPVTQLPNGNYLYSTPLCVDCTLRGTTQTPAFWK